MMCLNVLIISLMIVSLSYASILNIKPKKKRNRMISSKDRREKVSSDFVAIDLTGRFDTLVASWRSKEHGNKLEPLFRFSRARKSLLIPDLYIGGCYDLSKGLSNAVSRIASTLVWSLCEVRALNSYTISARIEKGLYEDNDVTTSVGVYGINGDDSIPILQFKFSSLIPSLEVDMSAFLWNRLRLSAKSKYVVDRDIPQFYYHSKVPDLDNNNDSWIPSARLMSNGLMECNSQIGVRSRDGAPSGFRISIRKHLSDWGTWMESEWQSESGLINFEYSTSNTEGDLYQSISIESDLNKNIIRNMRAVISVESIMQAPSYR